MSEPYLADIKIFGFNFAPRGYAQCDGQILPINQYQSLYSLLGTTYGGDGRTTFGLPDLRSRTPVHEGDAYFLGQKSGLEGVVLQENQMPAHKHALNGTDGTPASTAASSARLSPAGGGRAAVLPYGPATNLTALHSGTVQPTGGAAHSNMQPYQVLNFCIALQGVFPSRN